MWAYEVKFDGFRVQLHLGGEASRLYSRNGHDLSRRFRSLLCKLPSFSAKSAILDAELAACDADGTSNFPRLMREGSKSCGLCLWCFDLLSLDGRDLRSTPLRVRRDRLEQVLGGFEGKTVLRYSEQFENGARLFQEAERLGLEGIVCKRSDSTYVSDRSPAWVKVKTTAWRVANKERWKMFSAGERRQTG